MENTLLLALLQTLRKKEVRDIRKFLASPFFNLRQDVATLFDLLIEGLETGNSMPGKAAIHAQLYGADCPFDDHRVRMAMSLLLKLIEQYLVLADQAADEVASKIRLAKIYRNRDLPKHFERTMRDARAQYGQPGHRDATYFSLGYHLQLEQYRSDSAASRTGDLHLQAISDSLDLAYFARKLRQACLLLSHQAVYKIDYRFGLVDEILAEVERHPHLQVPAVNMYRYCYIALTRPAERAHFQQLKRMLVEEAGQFPAHEIADLYLLALNFCIKRYNEGEREYLAEQFDLYKEGLRHGFFLNNGVISRFTFRNAVTVGLVVGAFDWVEQVIHDFKGKLEPRHRESMLSFNLARLEYARGNHAAALRLLQKSEYTDLLLNLAAKTVTLKIFFETGEFDALESHLSAMQRFINRKKIMGYHRENYLNTIFFTRKLMENSDKAARSLLRAEIEATKSVGEREWLLGWFT